MRYESRLFYKQGLSVAVAEAMNVNQIKLNGADEPIGTGKDLYASIKLDLKRRLVKIHCRCNVSTGFELDAI